MIEREAHLAQVDALLRRHRIVAILGPRQVGKTTLARQMAGRRSGDVTFFDLENPRHLAALADPLLALEGLKGLVVIDEVQRRPDLFPVLRVLVDAPRAPKFLLLGSAAPELLRQSSESLAGRIAYHELGGLGVAEVGNERGKRLWLRGGFPRSFLARSELESFEWREEFLRTFLERDIPQLGFRFAAPSLFRLWNMLAHWSGQTLNSTELARSLGVSDHAIRHQIDVLGGVYMLRLLQPWHENVAKRQIKAPKIYVTDSGLLHALLGIRTRQELTLHPKVGASWEGYAVTQLAEALGARPGELFFWGTYGGAELDLLFVRGSRRLGFEIKLSDSPKVTPSMRTALADLKLDRLDVIVPGAEVFPLAEKIRVVGMDRLTEEY